MAFHHRKLIADAVNDTLQFCATHCDPSLGICPPICVTLCDINCDINHTYLSQSPPPPYFLTTLDDGHDGPVKKSHNVPLSLKLSLAILALSFSLLCSYTIYRCYIRWRRSRHRPRQQESESRDEFLDEDHGPVVDHPIWYIRTVGLNPSIINAITICKYKKSEGLVEGTDCSVCLSEFQEDETLRLLPKCNHAFHIPCIDTWLRSHTNCPLCRAGIVKNPAGSVLPEMIIENSTPGEETQLGVSENNLELSVGIEEEEEEEEPELGTKMNEITDGKVDSSALIQPVRRSVSLDSSAAAMISAAMANNVVGLGTRQSDGISDTRLVNLGKSNMGTVSKRLDVNQSLLRLVGSSSIGRSLQKGPTLMKRSLSSGGKVLLSRHSRSRSRSRSQDVVLRL